MNMDPLTETELDFINELLLKYGNNDSLFDVSELDGFLTAIVSGPEMIVPSQWFPALWGGAGKEPEWESETEMQRFMGLLIQHMNNNAAMLIECPDEFEALFIESEADGKQHTVVSAWCRGYMRVVAMHPQSWAAIPQDLEKHLGAIALFDSEDAFDQLSSLSETRLVSMQKKIEPAVRAIHKYFLAQRDDAKLKVNKPPVIATNKVGRNDPCPCGSGKKYKHCCLH